MTVSFFGKKKIYSGTTPVIIFSEYYFILYKHVKMC